MRFLDALFCYNGDHKDGNTATEGKGFHNTIELSVKQKSHGRKCDVLADWPASHSQLDGEPPTESPIGRNWCCLVPPPNRSVLWGIAWPCHDPSVGHIGAGWPLSPIPHDELRLGEK